VEFVTAVEDAFGTVSAAATGRNVDHHHAAPHY